MVVVVLNRREQRKMTRSAYLTEEEPVSLASRDFNSVLLITPSISSCNPLPCFGHGEPIPTAQHYSRPDHLRAFSPFRPAPQLKVDLRKVPNPPKAIRDAYTGVSKRLRDHMLEHDVFVELLKKAEAEIRATVESMIEPWRADKELTGSTTREEVISKEDELKNGEEEEEENVADVEEEDDNGSTIEDIVNESDRLVLTMGIFCAQGQHRSVAFAEELSRISWPKEWYLIVNHRDLGKKRGGATNQSGRDRKIRGADMLEDE